MSEAKLPVAIRAAVVNQRIYPPGSPIVERSLAQIMDALTPLFGSAGKVTITARQGKMHVNGNEAPEGDGLCAYFEEHGLQSLSITPEVSTVEIGQLILLLSKKKLPDADPKDWLQAQKVTHIALDKSTFVEIMEGEMVIKRVDQLFDGITSFTGLSSSLREAFTMMEKIPGEQERSEVKEHMARKVATLQPDIIRDLFQNPLPKQMEDSGLKAMVTNTLSQEKIQDIFSEIGNWYRQIRSQSGSDMEAVENLGKLKSFLNKLLSNANSKKVPFALYEELLQNGLLDEIPPDIEKKSDSETLAGHVDRMLEGSAPSLLEQPLREQLPALVKKLSAVGLDDMVDKLLKKLVENFQEGTPLVRQLAVKTSRQLMDILWTNRNEAGGSQLLAATLKLADGERLADVYQEAAEALITIVGHFILNERFSEAAQILALLRRHANEQNELAPKRTAQARQALEKTADITADVLMEFLMSDEPALKESAQKILSLLEEGAAPCLIRVLKRSENPRQRRQAADILKLIGEPAKKWVAAEVHVGNSTDSLLRILSVLDDFLSPELASRFEAMAHFPDSAVRRRMIQLLAKIPGAGAVVALRFLDDADESIQLEAIRAAGEARNREAVPKLIDFLREGSTRRLEETCLALGQIRDERAVPGLADILEFKSSGLFKRKAAPEETVRVRAAWALSQIPGGPAREILSRIAHDSNLQIQSIARQALAQA